MDHEHTYGDSGYCVHCGEAGPDADNARNRKALHAEERAGNWLAKGNEYSERGNKVKAEECYDKSTRWLMRANDLREGVTK